MGENPVEILSRRSRSYQPRKRRKIQHMCTYMLIMVITVYTETDRIMNDKVFKVSSAPAKGEHKNKRKPVMCVRGIVLVCFSYKNETYFFVFHWEQCRVQDNRKKLIRKKSFSSSVSLLSGVPCWSESQKNAKNKNTIVHNKAHSYIGVHTQIS